MKDLISFVVKEIIGDGTPFEVLESEDAGRTIYTIETDPNQMGLLIGKGGKTIKAIRSLARIKAILTNQQIRVELRG